MNEAIHHFLAAMKDSKLERDEVAFLLALSTGGKAPNVIAREIKVSKSGIYHIAYRLTKRKLTRLERHSARQCVYRLDTLGMTTIGKLAQSATTPEPVAHGIDHHPALFPVSL